MSYSVDVEVSNFRISAENRRKGLAALRAVGQQALRTGWSNGPILDDSYKRLEQYLEDCYWAVELDEEDAIVEMFREHETLAENEEVLFATLAPFIDAGAVIAFCGEDGNRWRYTFDGANIVKGKARVEWDDEDG